MILKPSSGVAVQIYFSLLQFSATSREQESASVLPLGDVACLVACLALLCPTNI